jgi:hypothetical protein
LFFYIFRYFPFLLHGLAGCGTLVTYGGFCIGEGHALFRGVEATLPSLEGEHTYVIGDVIIVEGQEYVLAEGDNGIAWFAFGTADVIEGNAIATSTKAGLVLASTEENAINVDATGVMTVNSLNVNKLVQTEDEELILNGGNA